MKMKFSLRHTRFLNESDWITSYRHSSTRCFWRRIRDICPWIFRSTQDVARPSTWRAVHDASFDNIEESRGRDAITPNCRFVFVVLLLFSCLNTISSMPLSISSDDVVISCREIVRRENKGCHKLTVTLNWLMYVSPLSVLSTYFWISRSVDC